MSRDARAPRPPKRERSHSRGLQPAAKRSAWGERFPMTPEADQSVAIPGLDGAVRLLAHVAHGPKQIDDWIAKRVVGFDASHDSAPTSWASVAWAMPPIAHPHPDSCADEADRAELGHVTGAGASSAGAVASSFWRGAARSSGGRDWDALCGPESLPSRHSARDQSSKGRPPVIGLDCEWRPVYTPGAAQRPVALLQLSWGRDVLLVPIQRIKTIPESLRALLASEHVLKAGVGIKEDALKLTREYGLSLRGLIDVSECHVVPLKLFGPPTGSAAAAAPPTDEAVMAAKTALPPLAGTGHVPGLLSNEAMRASLVEFLSHRRKFQAISLKVLTLTYCGVESWKSRSATMSNWEATPLQPRQVSYAALDAWAGAAITDSMFGMGMLDCGLARFLSTVSEPAPKAESGSSAEASSTKTKKPKKAKRDKTKKEKKPKKSKKERKASSE
jgi:hypothetical protein